MFLYDKKDNSIDVYDFTASEENLEKFRKEQMEQIPQDERIMFAETHVKLYGETPLLKAHIGKNFNNEILLSDYADNEEIKDTDKYGRYHVLKNDKGNDKENDKENDKKHEILLDLYIHGQFTDRSVVRIQYPEIMKYYLLRRISYGYLGEYDGGKNFKMEDIIQLPESLYLLQLLEQGRFTLLEDKDITKQLELYTLSKIYEVSLEELQKMDTYGITKNSYSNTITKAESDKQFLKRIKK